jgi:hypothetical protein
VKRLIAILLATLGLLLPLGSPASAEDGAYGIRPRKVVVNQSYEIMRWWVNDSSGCWTDADASLEHIATRDEADYDYSSGRLNGTFKFYDWNRYGRYRVVGTVWDDCWGDEASVTPTRLRIKRAVVASLSATRSGAYVSLASGVRAYDGGYPLWVKHRNASVSFQRKVNGAWRQVAVRQVPHDGVARAIVRKATASYYRAVVAPTKSAWGRTTITVRK